MENNIKNYNNLIYDNSPVKFNDYISNKYNIIHNELFNNALLKLIKDININNIETLYNNFKVIEIKNSEFYLPSTVILISKTFPHSKKEYDLSKYWNEYVFNKNNINDIKYNLENFKNLEIIYIDYVKGFVIMESRQDNVIINVDFDMIDPNNIKIGESYSLSNTFQEKINNL